MEQRSTIGALVRDAQGKVGCLALAAFVEGEQTEELEDDDTLLHLPWFREGGIGFPPGTMVVPVSTPDLNTVGPPPGFELGDSWIRPADEMTMVYVPAGSFLMGSAADDPEAEADEQPQHEVTLDGFWIDRTEVTAAQYALCVAAGDCTGGTGSGDYPVYYVNWNDAYGYCTWAGGRLPTEAEWEYAARGPQANRYPWGEEAPACELAQFSSCDGDTVPVGSLPAGRSWVGALDMAGNVWEWVRDWYNSDYYENSPATNPAGPSEGDYKVLRGGGWTGSSRYVRSADRIATRPGVRYIFQPEDRNVYFGFRCALPQAVDS